MKLQCSRVLGLVLLLLKDKHVLLLLREQTVFALSYRESKHRFTGIISQ